MIFHRYTSKAIAHQQMIEDMITMVIEEQELLLIVSSHIWDKEKTQSV
jgi:hypothetical protein